MVTTPQVHEVSRSGHVLPGVEAQFASRVLTLASHPEAATPAVETALEHASHLGDKTLELAQSEPEKRFTRESVLH